MPKLLAMKNCLLLLMVSSLTLASMSNATPYLNERQMEEVADTGTSTTTSETTVTTSTDTDSTTVPENKTDTETTPETKTVTPPPDENFPEGEKYDALDDKYDQESFDEFLNEIYEPLETEETKETTTTTTTNTDTTKTPEDTTEEKPVEEPVKEPVEEPVKEPVEEPVKEPEPTGPTPEELKEQYENEDPEEDVSMPDPEPPLVLPAPTPGEGEGSDDEDVEGAEPAPPAVAIEDMPSEEDVPENTVTDAEPTPPPPPPPPVVKTPPKRTFNDLMASYNLLMPLVTPDQADRDTTINEILMNLSQDYFDITLPGQGQFSRILQVINDSNRLRSNNINVSAMKNLHALHLQSIMNCMMVKDCNMERMLTSIASKVKQEHQIYRQLSESHFGESTETEPASEGDNGQGSEKKSNVMKMFTSFLTGMLKQKEKENNEGSRVLMFKKFEEKTLFKDLKLRKLNNTENTSGANPEVEDNRSYWARFISWLKSFFKKKEETRLLTTTSTTTTVTTKTRTILKNFASY